MNDLINILFILAFFAVTGGFVRLVERLWGARNAELQRDRRPARRGPRHLPPARPSDPGALPMQRQRQRERGADPDDEHHRVSQHAARVELAERVDEGDADERAVEQGASGGRAHGGDSGLLEVLGDGAEGEDAIARILHGTRAPPAPPPPGPLLLLP